MPTVDAVRCPLAGGQMQLENLPIDIALPNETLSAIFQQLPPVVLCVLCRVSQRFRSVAQHLLYSSISITDTLSQSAPIPLRTLRCCQSLLTHAHVTGGVKKLHIRWQSDPQLALSVVHLGPALQALRDALRTLAALESLELTLGPANLVTAGVAEVQHVHVLERIIDGCAFPILRQCALATEWAKGTPPYGSILTAFLAAHPSLRHLRLSDHHGALTIPPEALPHLSSFRGSPDAAASLLPGRPVTVLALVGQDSDVTPANLPRMAHTSVPLVQLDLSAMSVRPVLLQNLSTCLPGVRVLKVKLALRHTLHYALSGIRILTGLSSVLSAFPQLEFLDLSPTAVGGIGQSNLAEELSLCTAWNSACLSLRRIRFPSRNEWTFRQAGIWEAASE